MVGDRSMSVNSLNSSSSSSEFADADCVTSNDDGDLRSMNVVVVGGEISSPLSSPELVDGQPFGQPPRTSSLIPKLSMIFGCSSDLCSALVCIQ
ncbi:hypothetical protein RB195_009353 [Necator americanus]|uniref:Uncharacterized protein n=1 Tax=Necator americanus TaxID=51031 RepID=A0ABR1CTR8_NECAM